MNGIRTFPQVIYDAIPSHSTPWDELSDTAQREWSRVADAVISNMAAQDVLLIHPKINQMHEFLIDFLKPALTQILENPMALMSGGLPGMGVGNDFPPPPSPRNASKRY
jgi:hypothetical protein